MVFDSDKAQIALEFLIVYSFVLIVFVILFALVAAQRAITLNQQEYSQLQLQVQNIAVYIDQAETSGSGYYATIPVVGSIGTIPYNISISNTGAVIGQMKVGTQIVNAYSFSTARDLIVNGTPQQNSSGTYVYQIPIYKGYITLANENDYVYIDQKPPSQLSLFENVYVNVPTNEKAGIFNGANYAYGSVTSYFGGNNPLTAVAWAYITPSANGPIFGVTSCPPGSCWNMPFLSEEGLVVFGWIWGVNSNNPISYGVPHPGWYMLAMTYNPSGSGTETFYVDGAAVGTAYGQYSPSSATDYWTTYISGAKPLGMVNSYNSLIANVQAYSVNLTSSQIIALYREGINGAPIMPAKLISWWPLNGNLNDYSGNGNNGVGSGMQYGSVMQFDAKAINKAGTNATGIPIGFVTSKGAIGTISSFIANDTNSSGVLSEYLTANAATIGTANVTITPFNGNATIAANLIGWWPLDLGYGSNAYDLSGYGNTGTMQNVQWTRMPMPSSLTTAYFNGQSSSITGNLLFGTTNLTISAWINNTGKGAYWQNIAEIYGNQNTHETLDIGVTGAGGNAVIRWSNQANTFQNQPAGGTISPGRWYLVTGVWNGNKNTLSVYINGNLVATGVGNGTIGTFVNGFNIGGSYPGMNIFNGTISNVQLYNTALSPQQVMQQYKNGIGSLPISNAGLIGWWPLNGNANDYSSNGNNGISSNIGQKGITWNNTNSRYATQFNGQTGQYIAGDMPLNIPNTNPVTVTAWIYYKGNTGNWEGIFGVNWNCPFEHLAVLNNQLYLDDCGNDGGNFGSFPVPKNTWVFVAYTLSETNLVMYENNNNQSFTLSGAYQITPNAFDIGTEGVDFGRPSFNGSIADVQVFNAALTPREVQMLYQQGLPLVEKFNVSLG
jgi:hypothetical protein